MYWLILIVVALVTFYIYKSITINYWKNYGIPYVKPYPFVGNMEKLILRQESFNSLLTSLYKPFPDAKYIGYLNFSKPYIMLKDPELIKMIAVKDFDNFVNRRIVLSEDIDPLFGKSLVSLEDQRWRDMRSTLSPSFTSSKMRAMFMLISECGEQFVNYFVNKVDTLNGEPLIIEMKDVFTRFTNDVIATTAFGLKVDSLQQPKNEFYLMGKKITATSFKGLTVILGYSLCPELMKKLHISFIPSTVTTFFKGLILETMKIREQEYIIRPDMIHLLMEAKKGKLRHEEASEADKNMLDTGFATIEESSVGKEQRSDKNPLSDEDLVAQAFIFFLAGFETSSTTMCFTAHELAINPDCQAKLQAEIDEILQENNGKLTYETLNSMKYMDMVVSESLRKWTPAIIVDRICGKPYKLPDPYSDNNENKTVTIEPGVGFWLPIQALHHDPKYYPDPHKYDPERFSDENKHNINPFTYLPFGIGPRACIGSRFALMEVKMVLFYMLSKFDFVVCSKTQNPLEIDKSSFNLTVKNGFWLEMKPRNTTQL